LPPGKTGGFAAVGIDARKSLAIRIINDYLPMTMLSTPVFAKRCAFFCFLQGWFQFGSQKYLKFHPPLQVLVKITRLPRIWPIFRALRVFALCAPAS